MTAERTATDRRQCVTEPCGSGSKLSAAILCQWVSYSINLESIQTNLRRQEILLSAHERDETEFNDKMRGEASVVVE